MLTFVYTPLLALVRHLLGSQVKWSYTKCTLTVWVARVGFHQKPDETKVSVLATVVEWSVAVLLTILDLPFSRLGVTAPLYHILCTCKLASHTGLKKFVRHIVKGNAGISEQGGIYGHLHFQLVWASVSLHVTSPRW